MVAELMERAGRQREPDHRQQQARVGEQVRIDGAGSVGEDEPGGVLALEFVLSPFRDHPARLRARLTCSKWSQPTDPPQLASLVAALVRLDIAVVMHRWRRPNRITSPVSEPVCWESAGHRRETSTSQAVRGGRVERGIDGDG